MKIFSGSSFFIFPTCPKFTFALKAYYGIFLFHYLSACSLGCMECRGREEETEERSMTGLAHISPLNSVETPEFYPALQTLKLGGIISVSEPFIY